MAAKAGTLGTMRLRFLKDDAVSLNGRTYPVETVDSLVSMAQEDLAKGTPLTFFACHADGLGDDASKMAGTITRVWKESGAALADVAVLDTSRGRDIAGAVKGGGLKTISLRCSDFATTEGTKGKTGAGTIATVTRARLAGIDATMNPGIPEASIEAFLLETQESVDGLLYEAVDVTGTDLVEAEQAADDDTGGTERAYTKAERDAMPAEDFAGPDQSYPIKTQADVDNAARLVGHAADPAAVKATIIAIATRKGLTLPDAWQDKKTETQGAPADGQEGEDMPLTLEQIKQAAKEAATEALAEAAHSHVHSHMGADGTTYQHEHTHPHTGTSDHSAADAHVHSHNNSYAFEALEELSADQLVEAAATVIDRATVVIAADTAKQPTEAGRSISQANQDKIKAIHDHAADLLGLDCCPSDDAGGSDAPMGGDESTATPQKVEQLTALTEALTSKTVLTEEVATLKVQLAEQTTAHAQALTEAATALTEARNLLEAEKLAHTTLTERVTSQWRPHRKVPVEAFSITLTEGDQEREATPKETIRAYSEALAGKLNGR